jgi:3-oxoacyl-[acyl-carrier protein] reductase
MDQDGNLLITGTSRGLGKLLAEHYLLSGGMVFGCSRADSTISHRNYRHFKVNIADELSIISMFKEMADLKVKLDLVINNAGLTQSSLGILTSANTAREIIEVNILGTFLVIREALKLMYKQRYGRIVNFSSINVPLGSSGSAIYSGCKAGVEAMTLPLTRECGNADITINTIGLSLVDKSGMLDSLSPKALAAKQSQLLKPELLNLDEICHAIDFFASPLSKNISSQTIYFGGI